MKKYIHYCWFGDKPLSKLALKCIKSWQKYLPDYEIKKWDESNCDVNECPFVKEAYANKKWAFVADYFRTKALNEYGGIYFDTDMEIIKNIDHLLNHKTFLGVEDTGAVAVGVWYEQTAHAVLPELLLNKYKSFSKFVVEDMNKNSIPHLITGILEDMEAISENKGIKHLENDIFIYPRDYFYPLSMHRDNNIFTDNTCMVHYYDASWLSKKQKLEMHTVRLIGRKKTLFLEDTFKKVNLVVRKVGRIILFPIALYRHKKRKDNLIDAEYLERKDNTIKLIYQNKDKDYITFYNKKWFGVTSATKELFENLVDCGELFRKKDIKEIAAAIKNTQIKQIVFSSFAIGWKDLAISLKKDNRNIKLKTFWHGSHSQILDEYGWNRNLEIIQLHKRNIIDIMGTCKKSLMEFYKQQGFKAQFITNRVILNSKPTIKQRKKAKKLIGIYAAKCDDWRKNMYTQIAAVALIENAVIDMVPLNDDAIAFAKSLNVPIQGEHKSIPREKLIERMAKDDAVLYVTFSECAPMLPLEALEVQVPCLTGNNHHYFKNKELEKYLVINEEDNPFIIKEKLLLAIKNKDKINKLYKDFAKENNLESKKELKKFLEM